MDRFKTTTSRTALLTLKVGTLLVTLEQVTIQTETIWTRLSDGLRVIKDGNRQLPKPGKGFMIAEAPHYQHCFYITEATLKKS